MLVDGESIEDGDECSGRLLVLDFSAASRERNDETFQNDNMEAAIVYMRNVTT